MGGRGLAGTSGVCFRRIIHALLVAAGLSGASPRVVSAQSRPPESIETGDGGASVRVAPRDTPPERVLGVLPSFLTTNAAPGTDPLPPHRKFALAALTSFDPSRYPFVAVMAGVSRSYGPGIGGYGKQYAASFSDNVIGNLLTSGALPSLFGQDPRYYRRGEGAPGLRAVYAASRVLIAYGDAGHRRVNSAELVGVTGAAAISNLYYPHDQRTAAGTVNRLAFQMLWDGVANELQEFWPDINRRLHRRH